MRIILGLLITLAGAAMTIKTEPVYNFTGAIAWAEEHVGSTRTFLKLLGALAVFVGLATMTGVIDGIIFWFVSLLFPTLRGR